MSEYVDLDKNKLKGREKGLLVGLIVAVVVAVLGFVLYFTSQPPSDAAAKVNDTYISESDVAHSINSYRIAYSLTDDATFAAYISEQGTSVSQLRIQLVNQLALRQLVDARAKELGVVPSDSEVQAKIDELKSGSAFNDDSIWQSTLEQNGLTEDDLKAQYKMSMEEDAIFEKDVIHETATDDQTLSYAQNYLAGVEQKHAYRIVFTGDGNYERAVACAQELATLKEAGNLTLDTFETVAAKYTNEENFATTKGELGWSVDVSTDEDLTDLLDELNAGEYSSPTTITADNAIEIIYCDTAYTFPDSSNISNLTKSDVPTSLWPKIKDYASDALWSNNCTTYLEYLLSRANMTYYPIPSNATYNVDFAKVS